MGGDVRSPVRDLCACIQREGLAVDHDGGDFIDAGSPASDPLRLFAHEMAWLRAGHLEAFCVAHGSTFMRRRGT